MDREGFENVFGKAGWPQTPFSVHAFVADVQRVNDDFTLMLELLSIDEKVVSPALFSGSLAQVKTVFASEDPAQLEGQWRTFQLARMSGERFSISILASLADPEGISYGIRSGATTPQSILLSHSKPPGSTASIQDVVSFLANGARKGSMKLAVVDVGQGAAAFLYQNRRTQPTLYLDIGGGCAFNAKTFPAGGVHWCFTNRPGILLSHWHWDHWAGATYGGLANCAGPKLATWLVPSTPAGPLAKKFVAAIIAAGGTVMHWPAGHLPISANGLLVGEATGTGWNNSGLALLMELEPERFSLAPGDAAYSFLPAALQKSSLKTLLISHHGGYLEMNPPAGLPLPDGSPNCHAYCSVGDQNTFSHPTIIPAYIAAGWQVTRTDGRLLGTNAKHFDAETAGLVGGVVSPRCNGTHCSLELST